MKILDYREAQPYQDAVEYAFDDRKSRPAAPQIKIDETENESALRPGPRRSAPG